MDIGDTIQPKSDQQNYEDYITGPKTVTISEAKVIGDPKQPVHLHLVEFPGRPYKPNLTMRKLLVKAWGPDSSRYVGRRMTLYGEKTVAYGGKEVGGIRISHLSDLTEPVTEKFTITRGRRDEFTVLPLATPTVDESVVVDALADINTATSLPALRAAWDLAGKRGVQKHPDVIAAKEKRKQELDS